MGFLFPLKARLHHIKMFLALKSSLVPFPSDLVDETNEIKPNLAFMQDLMNPIWIIHSKRLRSCNLENLYSSF